MYRYEISKYDPKYREYHNGYRFYTKSEWTAISDIGKSFENVVLSADEYLRAENAYTDAVRVIMRFKQVDTLIWKANHYSKWQGLETMKSRNLSTAYECLYSEELYSFYHELRDGLELNEDSVCMAVRLLLREDIGGMLTSPRKIKIYVGYDYLMGVDSSSSLLHMKSQIENLGLFLEQSAGGR